MRYEGFLTDVAYSGWLSMHGLSTWQVATYRDKNIMLLYRLNQPYGMAIEVRDRFQGHGYDVVTQIDGLPPTQYEILPENNTLSRVANERDYHDIAIDVARRIDVAFRR